MSNATATAKKKGGFLAGTANYLDERVGVAGILKEFGLSAARMHGRTARNDAQAVSGLGFQVQLGGFFAIPGEVVANGGCRCSVHPRGPGSFG